MADTIRPIGLDGKGYEIVTNAVLNLLSQFPGLANGQEILFEELSEDGGIAFSANNGSLVMEETEDILGGYVQKCQYPFFLVYRTASTREFQKLRIQEFLDTIGKWLCGEPVEIKGNVYRLSSFPSLSDGRKITRITRMNSYGTEPNQNGVQDWILPVTVNYTNIIEPLW